LSPGDTTSPVNRDRITEIYKAATLDLLYLPLKIL